MFRSDWVTASDTTAVQAGIHLLNTRVYGLETVETLLELGRQTLVCLSHVAEEGITTCCRTVKEIQEGGAGGLLLKCDIRVPGDRVGTLLQEFGTCAVVGATVN